MIKLHNFLIAWGIFIFGAFVSWKINQWHYGAPTFQVDKKHIEYSNYKKAIYPIASNLMLNEEKKKLGQLLFFDPRLSKNNDTSCATCHDLSNGGDDGLVCSKNSQGLKGDINAPTVFNSAFNFRQFWDGRADTLEEQVNGPVTKHVEMNTTWPDIISKLKKDRGMVAFFKQQYPKQGISRYAISNSIAIFERSLTTPNSRFDLFLKGEQSALTAKEKEGYQLFKEIGCISCHQGINMGGNFYEKLGVVNDYFKDKGKITKADLGRFNLTADSDDKYEFKVPSLRNIALTAPYFHDGSAKTLEKAVNTMAYYQLGVRLKDNERQQLVDFLKTLTGRYQGKAL